MKEVIWQRFKVGQGLCIHSIMDAFMPNCYRLGLEKVNIAISLLQFLGILYVPAFLIESNAVESIDSSGCL